jgi:hypothetical protein
MLGLGFCFGITKQGFSQLKLMLLSLKKSCLYEI